ncbi:MAG: alpha-hydroxy-acid oxidizing protein [Gammaproteobacteria bacterium]|nr:alpha-hydroxy-acid oxidizing protein [Gammaproteobacteria bacterium]
MREAANIEELRVRARRRLPRAIFDFIDGGARDEVTLRRNRRAFEAVLFNASMMIDASEVVQSTELFGTPMASPVILGPTGLAGLSWPRGEIEVARAAQSANAIYVAPLNSSCTLEEVAQAGSEHLWWQLYVSKNRERTESHIERAQSVGYRAMVLTIDVQLASIRERDVFNGFTIPPRITARNAIDVLRRARWLRSVLLGPRITLANHVDPAGGPSDLLSLAQLTAKEIDSSLTWEQLRWFRERWTGPLILKGIMNQEDARRAVDHGADGIVVSNHGGRQLDGMPASIEVLPSIADAVGSQIEVLLDSGVRRGSDVVKALALGAKAVMVGRPYLYGLAAHGGAGVGRALGIFRDEVAETLGLLGAPDIAQLSRDAIYPPGANVQDAIRT